MEKDFKTLSAQYQKLKALLDTTAKISHEMNQPLTGIAGYCALLKEQLDQSSPVFNDVVEIERQSERLESLIHQLQDVVVLEFQSSEGENRNP